ncbi:MAG: RHS repeat-associated core domain-containing protein [Bacteroidia bacterium]
MNGFSKIPQTDFPITCTTGYRFGFNGKENDNEVKGRGNSLDFGGRIYDSRLGKWLSLDPLHSKYASYSPYNFVLNMPIIAIDPSGEKVFFVINTGGVRSEYAETRKNEIEHSKGFNSKVDIVVTLYVPDLGTLEKKIEDAVAKYSGTYGKTEEASFYGHGGVDGPSGGDKTSGEYNLADLTGNWDKIDGDFKQLSPDGWKAIDFNFDPTNSVASFYGCNTDEFAQKFLSYSNVQNAAGTQGGTGPSYNASGNFSHVWFNFLGTSVYQAAKADGKVLPMNVYSQDSKQATYNEGDQVIPLILQDANGNVIPQKETKAQVSGNVTTDNKGKPVSGSK